MAGLGRGLGALLSASHRNKAKLSGDNAVYGGVNRSLSSHPTEEADPEILVTGKTSALNNLLSTKMPESKSLKRRPLRGVRSVTQALAQNQTSAPAALVDTVSLNQTLAATKDPTDVQLPQNANLKAPGESQVANPTITSKPNPQKISLEQVETSIAASAKLTPAEPIESVPSVKVEDKTNAQGKAKAESAAPYDPAGQLPTDEASKRTVVVASGSNVTPPLKIAETNVVHTILLTNLKASVYQPRTDFSAESLQELADSIKEHGLLEPLLVTRSNQDPKSYEIICGERRFRAAQLAGLRAVPCLIRELSDDKAYAVALIENIQREDLSPLEIARAYEQMMHQCKYTQENLAKSVGKSRSTIANTLRLLKLELEVQKALRVGDIDVGHAKILLALSGENQINACKTVIEQQMSVAATDVMVKELIKKLKAEKETPARIGKAKALPRFNNYEKYLNKSLKGVKAKFVVKNESQGKLTLSYTSVSELEYLLQVLGIPGAAGQSEASSAE